MAALNYYLGLRRGAEMNPENVTAGTATAGTAVDVEVRLQADPGTGATGLTRHESVLALQQIIAFIEGGGQGPGDGANLPAT
jgi:hypothetical protein